MPDSQIETAATADFREAGLIVVAAGSGERFGGYKQLADLAGKPLLAHTLYAFEGIPILDRVVVLPDEFIEEGSFAEHIGPHLRVNWKVAKGGRTRAESVLNGCRELAAETKFALIHDGARPFPPVAAAARALTRLQDDPRLAAVIVASPVTDTIKRVAGDGLTIQATEDRNSLRRAETPQVCRKALLLETLSKPEAASASDDASALEIAGYQTAVEVHDGVNLKITRPMDLVVAKAIQRYL